MEEVKLKGFARDKTFGLGERSKLKGVPADVRQDFWKSGRGKTESRQSPWEDYRLTTESGKASAVRSPAWVANRVLKGLGRGVSQEGDRPQPDRGGLGG